MRAFILLCVLFFASNVFGSTNTFGVKKGSTTQPPAGEPTIIDEAHIGGSSRYLNAYALGQGPFDLGGDPFYSFSLKSGSTTEAGNITCRIGAQLDLSTLFTEEFTYTGDPGADSYFEVMSVTNPAMTTAYIACNSDVAINVVYDTSDSHAGSDYVWQSYPGWDLEVNATRDMVFILKVLQ